MWRPTQIWTLLPSCNENSWFQHERYRRKKASIVSYDIPAKIQTTPTKMKTQFRLVVVKSNEPRCHTLSQAIHSQTLCQSHWLVSCASPDCAELVVLPWYVSKLVADNKGCSPTAIHSVYCSSMNVNMEVSSIVSLSLPLVRSFFILPAWQACSNGQGSHICSLLFAILTDTYSNCFHWSIIGSLI